MSARFTVHRENSSLARMGARQTTSLSARSAHVREQAVFIHAAVLAAHAGGTRSFRASDVRFFFLLFTNWVEHDIVRPGQDVDLTQVRRAIERLARAGWARRVSRERGDGSGGRRYALTESGLVGVAEEIVGTTGRPFDEMLFVLCFVASYRDALLARVPAGVARLASPTRRRLATLLDPRAVLAVAKESTRAVLVDLTHRIESSRSLEREAEAARGRGADDVAIVRHLETLGSYQLHRVRTLREVLMALPEDIRRFELTRGMSLRASVLFEPLAERARAELAILEALGGSPSLRA